MSFPGAYADEMGRFLRLSDEELARLLAGEAAVCNEAFEEVASVVTEARRSFSAPPDAATRAFHMAAISETSQLGAEDGHPVTEPVDVGLEQASSRPATWRRVISLSKSVLLKGSAAALAASMSMVGLAYAGVDLPGSAAEQALEAVLDVELPNQAGSGGDPEDVGSQGEVSDLEAQGPSDAAAEVAREIWDYISTTEDTGCVFGQNVAAIASGGDHSSDHACGAGASGSRVTGADAAGNGLVNKPTDPGADAAGNGQVNRPTDPGADDTDDTDDPAEEGRAKNPTGRP